MNKTITILLIFVSSFFVQEVYAQDYNFAAGFRVGKGLYTSLKKSVKEDVSLEAFAGVNSLRSLNEIDYFAIGFLFQVHEQFNVDRFYWYWGGGSTIAFLDDSYVGTNLNIGLDYSLTDLPLNFSLDYAPILRFNDGIDFDWQNIGFTMRYIIVD